MNNFCHNDLVFSFSQIYQIIIIWNNQRNIFHHHSQNQAKEKRPFKTSLPLRQSNAHPSQQNAPVRLICARTGPILSQIYRPIKLMFKKSVQTPFKIKMQFNSIKLFARFVFLGWLFNFISNLLLFNQTDYVLLYTVFTHFVLPPLHKKEACLLLPKNRPLYEKVSIPSMPPDHTRQHPANLFSPPLS